MLIVDDHALVREGTVQLLDQEPDLEVVANAGTAEDALDVISGLAPDVAVVDVNLPGMSGLALARIVATRHPHVRILVLSAYDEYAYVTEALEIGVGGYLLKTASSKELVDAVRAVADGILVLDRALAELVSRHGQGRSKADPGPEPLTPREAEVLGLLARGRSNKQIAANLCLSLRTVEGYVSNVLTKLGVESRTAAALYARDHPQVSRADHEWSRGR